MNIGKSMNNRQKEILGILLCMLAFFMFLSFLTYNPLETPSGLSSEISKKNIMGIFGIYTSYYLMKFSFGWGTFFLPLIMGIHGYSLFSRKSWRMSFRISANLVGLGIWLSLVLAGIGSFEGGMWEAEFPGFLGYVLWNFLKGIFGLYATFIILIVFLIILLSGFLHFSIYDFFKFQYERIKNKYMEWKEKRKLVNVIIKSDQAASPEIEKGDIEFKKKKSIKSDIDDLKIFLMTNSGFLKLIK